MKIKVFKDGVFLALSAIAILCCGYSASAISGEIDYGGNVGQIDSYGTDSYLVEALDDGGYATASLDGEQNGAHVYYGSIVTPIGSGTNSDTAASAAEAWSIKNPVTIDGITLSVVEFVAAITTGCVLVKRLGRRC